VTQQSPRASVVIPTHNGCELLAECLRALQQQTYPDFETIVVDDASTDGTAELLARMPWVEVVRLPGSQGHGFVAACNRGLARARGEVLVLLNNDAVPEPEWLGALVDALDRNPWAAMAASKLLLYDSLGKLHSAGDYYAPNGVPNSRGVWQADMGQYDREEEVFGPSAAAAAYRRSMLADLAGCGGTQPRGRVLDPQLWMYCEDVDLNLRARLRDYRTVYVPTARVRHRLSATGGGILASYYVGRNLLYVIAKDLPSRFIRRHIGAIVRAQLRFAWEAARNIRGAAARARLRGMAVGLVTWPRVLPSRRRVMRSRRVSDAELEEAINRYMP
jgi:GT2 family glycosyltransferase